MDDEEVTDPALTPDEERPMGGPRSQRRRRRPRAERPSERPSREGRGGAAKPRLKELCELSSFSVFCALYLGIAQDDSYAPAGADTVRRRFDLSDAEFKDYLETHGLTGEDVRRAMAGANLRPLRDIPCFHCFHSSDDSAARASSRR